MGDLRQCLSNLRDLSGDAVLLTRLAPEGGRWILPSRETVTVPELPDELPQALIWAEARAAHAQGTPRHVQAAGISCLLEPVTPGRLAPWMHFALQLQAQGKPGVTAVIASADGGSKGEWPYQVGDTFALDAHSHGLVPLENALNIALHRQSQALLGTGETRLASVDLPGGRLTLLFESF